MKNVEKTLLTNEKLLLTNEKLLLTIIGLSAIFIPVILIVLSAIWGGKP